MTFFFLPVIIPCSWYTFFYLLFHSVNLFSHAPVLLWNSCDHLVSGNLNGNQRKEHFSKELSSRSDISVTHFTWITKTAMLKEFWHFRLKTLSNIEINTQFWLLCIKLGHSNLKTLSNVVKRAHLQTKSLQKLSTVGGKNNQQLY